MGTPKVAEFCVTALEPSLDDIEQAVDSSDVIEEVVVRGVRPEEVVFDRVKSVVDGRERPANVVAASERERCHSKCDIEVPVRDACENLRPPSSF